MAAAGIGGALGGAITGSATGLSANLTTGIIHGDNIGRIIGSAYKGAALGAIIGGVVGGVDASLKGQRFFDGKGKVATERYLLGSGNTPSVENPYYPPELVSQYGEVSSDGFSEWNPEISRGFDGDLIMQGMANPESGETFRIMTDGKTIFETTKSNTRISVKVPSSNHDLTWGVYGDKISTQITNILPNTNQTLNEVVVTANRYNSYIRIFGNHRSWNGFLFWR